MTAANGAGITPWRFPASVDTLNVGDAREEGVLMGRPSKYLPEFREHALELVRATGKTLTQVARELSVNHTTLSNWIKADKPSGVCRMAPGCR